MEDSPCISRIWGNSSGSPVKAGENHRKTRRSGRTPHKKQRQAGKLVHKVSTCVWTELMRSRLQKQGPEALLATIEAESNCRIHIDRDELRVQMHGNAESLAIACSILESLEERCCEEVVLFDTSFISACRLEQVTQDCGVVIATRQQGGERSIFGLKGRVALAMSKVQAMANESTSTCLRDSGVPKLPIQHSFPGIAPRDVAVPGSSVAPRLSNPQVPAQELAESISRRNQPTMHSSPQYHGTLSGLSLSRVSSSDAFSGQTTRDAQDETSSYDFSRQTTREPTDEDKLQLQVMQPALKLGHIPNQAVPLCIICRSKGCSCESQLLGHGSPAYPTVLSLGRQSGSSSNGSSSNDLVRPLELPGRVVQGTDAVVATAPDETTVPIPMMSFTMTCSL